MPPSVRLAEDSVESDAEMELARPSSSPHDVIALHAKAAMQRRREGARVGFMVVEHIFICESSDLLMIARVSAGRPRDALSVRDAAMLGIVHL